jgi:hypothetical protein
MGSVGASEARVLDNHTSVRWFALDALRDQDPPFYPDGMIDLAAQLEPIGSGLPRGGASTGLLD